VAETPDDDEAASRINAEPLGMTLRVFTPAEAAATDEKPSTSPFADHTDAQLLEMASARTVAPVVALPTSTQSSAVPPGSAPTRCNPTSSHFFACGRLRYHLVHPGAAAASQRHPIGSPHMAKSRAQAWGGGR
jgi:hypothetical protein